MNPSGDITRTVLLVLFIGLLLAGSFLTLLPFLGGLIWGFLPGNAGISWQAHLGGAVGGVLAAWLLHRRATRRVVTAGPMRRY